MNKYKINYIFSEEGNINEILISVLTRELQRNFQVIYNCKNEKAKTFESDK